MQTKAKLQNDHSLQRFQTNLRLSVSKNESLSLICGKSHGIRNELEASEQKRERGSLQEDAESRQGLSALMISPEGKDYIIEKAVVFAGSSLVSYWRGMQERQQP